MTYAASLVGRLDPAPVVPDVAPAGGANGDEPDAPAPPADQESAGASKDVDVTAHCDERRAIVRTKLDES